MPSFIKGIRKINSSIEDSAESSDWSKVERLAQERHQMLEAFFDDSADILDQTTLTSIQTTVRLNDENVRSIIERQKKSLVQSGLNLRHSHNAVNQYRTTRNTLADS